MAEIKKVWYRKLLRKIRLEIRWLIPGVGIKRWILVVIFGTTLLGVGFAMFLLDAYRTTPDVWWVKAVSLLYLNFLERELRAVVFTALGVGLVIVGIWGLNRTLLRPFMRPGKPILEAVTAHRRRDRGPRVVAIGGGNGLSSLLRGLKSHTFNLTAVVTVADDGGSSGELRKSMGILPPGDIRNCLAALSDDEALLTQLFQYRFSSGAGLNGHSLGNLLITALTDITGSFEGAVAESGRVLAVRGRVVPATLHDVRLLADVRQGEKEMAVLVKGESQIPKAEGKVTRVWMEPDAPPAFPPAVQAILNADIIVVGPGSLYTSIIPNLLVPDITAAIKASRALKIYICNVATQPGETDGYRAGDHLRALEGYIGKGVFDLMVCNQSYGSRYSTQVDWVEPEADLDQFYPVHMADLLDEVNPWRHDSKKVGQVVIDLFYEKTGPQFGRDD